MAAAVATMAAEAAVPASRMVPTIINGENIFVYTNLRTKQTVYSLTRSMWAKKALKQLTFAGKKSVPGGIRKDFWRPLCVLSFPSPAQGLDAYRKMREFKMLHETAWDKADMVEQEGPGAGVKLKHWKERRRAIQDQKANSIADMAAVLRMQATPPTDAEVAKAKWWNRRPIITMRGKRVPAPDRPKRGMGKKETLGRIEWQGNVEGVTIHWTDIMDAEYAETWPDQVLHGQLDVRRHTAVWPPTNPDEVALEEAVENALDAQAEADSAADGVVETAPEPEKKGGWLSFGKK